MVSVIQPRSEVQAPPTPALADTWRDACAELNLLSTTDGAKTVVHEVNICLNIGQRGGVHTEYRTRIDAPGVPAFRLTKRTMTAAKSAIETGDRTFDSNVVIRTNDHAALRSFLTAERRLAISQLLHALPAAEVTNKYVTAWSKGIEQDGSKVTSTMRRVVDTAELMRPCWTDVALDERSVVEDLFDAGRDLEQIALRFDDLYWGNSVTWSGEVLTVGATDSAGTRAAVLIGTAHGAASQGRVVVLTALAPELLAAKGDVVDFSGSLWNLDAGKRLLTVE